MSKSPLLLTFLLIFIVIQNNAQRTEKPSRSLNLYGEYKPYYWTTTQCSLLKKERDATLDVCKELCNLNTDCTAINFHNNWGCETMNCSTFPPYPFSLRYQDDDLYRPGDDWRGYSKYHLTYSGRYYGPYGTHWSNDQCEAIGMHNDKNRVLCEKICDDTPECSGFNFHVVKGHCIMRKCVPNNPPVRPSALKADWESYSKVDISEKVVTKKWHDNFRCGKFLPLASGEKSECDPLGKFPCCSDKGWCGHSEDHCTCDSCIDYSDSRWPIWSCPSFHCKVDDIPLELDKMTYEEKYDYDGRCKCESDVWCYHRVPKCKGEGENYRPAVVFPPNPWG